MFIAPSVITGEIICNQAFFYVKRWNSCFIFQCNRPSKTNSKSFNPNERPTSSSFSTSFASSFPFDASLTYHKNTFSSDGIKESRYDGMNTFLTVKCDAFYHFRSSLDWAKWGSFKFRLFRVKVETSERQAWFCLQKNRWNHFKVWKKVFELKLWK